MKDELYSEALKIKWQISRYEGVIKALESNRTVTLESIGLYGSQPIIELDRETKDYLLSYYHEKLEDLKARFEKL